MRFLTPFLAALALLAPARAAPAPAVAPRTDADERLVFCHFMMGIVSNRAGAADYADDMQRARAAGIDAFALNIGTDNFTDTQLGYAYAAAADAGLRVFLSFDFSWYAVDGARDVGAMIARYAGEAAQLRVGGKVFASSFAGDGVDSQAIRDAAGLDIFWAPNFRADADTAAVDGLLNWMAWPNNGDNKAPDANRAVSVADGDAAYRAALGDKPLIAPISPWFSTHFGGEVSYSKNWVFPSDMLIYRRWLDILQSQPQYVELLTWNDYGESHYMGPLSSPHTDDGSSKWVNDMPHTGWLELSKPFIAAYKAGAPSPADYITEDRLVYWYRTTPAALDCDAADPTAGPANNASGNFVHGRPAGAAGLADAVFVVALLTAPGTAGVNTGGTVHYFDAPAGASAFSVPFLPGPQSFIVLRGGAPVLRATSLREIAAACPCAGYNFNAYVGTVPAGPVEALDEAGRAAFGRGLAGACDATPALGVDPPEEAAITTTMAMGSAAPTAPAVRRA
ncbi:glycoside hydrolase family 71 protein [Schizophyllum fasciatum]